MREGSTGGHVHLTRNPAFALVFALVCICSLPVHAGGGGNHLKKAQLTSTRCLAKGGIGAVFPGLYIDLKSGRNELILEHGKRWTGQTANRKEVAVYFNKAVGASESLPPDFNLDEAVVFSFEGTLIRFFDFNEGKGCYYKRATSEPSPLP
jgi:hypothetical protein